MTTYSVIIHGKSQREHAHKCVDKLPLGGHVQFKTDIRTDLQNRKLWPLLQDIRDAKLPGREHYSRDDWKCVFMKTLGQEVRYLHDINGRPFDPGMRSSRLTKSEFADLMTLVIQYGDQNGVQWTGPEKDDWIAEQNAQQTQISPDPLPSSQVTGEQEGGARSAPTEAPSSGYYGEGELEALRKFRDGLFGSDRSIDGAMLLKGAIKADLKSQKAMNTAFSMWQLFKEILKKESTPAEGMRLYSWLDSESEAA